MLPKSLDSDMTVQRRQRKASRRRPTRSQPSRQKERRQQKRRPPLAGPSRRLAAERAAQRAGVACSAAEPLSIPACSCGCVPCPLLSVQAYGKLLVRRSPMRGFALIIKSVSEQHLVLQTWFVPSQPDGTLKPFRTPRPSLSEQRPGVQLLGTAGPSCSQRLLLAASGHTPA